MLKWNDPQKPHEIEIDGVKFFARVLTSGQRLTMLDEIRALRGTEGDFDDLMGCLAQYVERIEVPSEGSSDDGITITDAAAIKQNILYLDNLDHSYKLMEELMAVNQLSKTQVKN